MAFEAEVFPLMIIGVLAVSALEAVLGALALRGKKAARRKLLAHVGLMLAGFYFLFRCVFDTRMGVAAIPSIDHSVSMGLFGLFWAASAVCVVSLVGGLVKGE